MPWLPSSGRAMIPATQEAIRRHHSLQRSPGQCGSVHVQRVSAPLPLVWSLVRRFDRPQEYKRFVRTCALQAGDGGVGSVREVRVVSGLPAGVSTERLDKLDDEQHVMGFSIVGGDHRLVNYRSTISLHVDDEGATVVVESYVVNVPRGSTEEETCIFADTIIKCNLRSLAHVAEGMAARYGSNGQHG
ncbi:abscisic acid receptor PYL12-like [Typha angustifolia]|uniref:abscisic acid receptor PYL12-like n=1 Tax=Typha angustifolia TaxID=59011 RepID=UPI003C2DF393